MELLTIASILIVLFWAKKLLGKLKNKD